MCIARYVGGIVWNNFMPIYDESRNSRWRSSKPEVPIFQLVEELAAQFQIIIPRLPGRAMQWPHCQHCNTTTAVGIQDGGRLNQSHRRKTR